MGGLQLREGGEQFAVYAAEAAIAHHEQNIPGVGVGDNMRHEVVHALAEVAFCPGGAYFVAECGFIQPLIGGEFFVVFDRGESNEVSRAECGG